MGKHKHKKHRDHASSSYSPYYNEKHNRQRKASQDLAENIHSQSPTDDLWIPLEKELKALKCWRCKGYGHKSGDPECPHFLKGTVETERFRWSHEDPMRQYIENRKKQEQEERIEHLKSLIESSSSDSSSGEEKHHKKKRKKDSKSSKHRNMQLKRRPDSDGHVRGSNSSHCDKTETKKSYDQMKHKHSHKEKKKLKERRHKHHKSKHKKDK